MGMKLKKAASKVEDGTEEKRAYMVFSRGIGTCICTNNMLERLNREICESTRVVDYYLDGICALMLVCAGLAHCRNAVNVSI